MKVNPDKCQAISFGKRGKGVITDFTCGMTQVRCEDSVVLLGIELDRMLTFTDSVFARIERGQGADLGKGHFCAAYHFEGTFVRGLSF